MKFVQCKFARGEERTTGFIESGPQIKPGVQISLIDPETKQKSWWTIESVGQPTNRESIKRGWDNNI